MGGRALARRTSQRYSARQPTDFEPDSLPEHRHRNLVTGAGRGHGAAHPAKALASGRGAVSGARIGAAGDLDAGLLPAVAVCRSVSAAAALPRGAAGRFLPVGGRGTGGLRIGLARAALATYRPGRPGSGRAFALVSRTQSSAGGDSHRYT